ncbi:hypothetical protein Q5P01_003915 [Channa striata]|uniref:Uncharacterized protein n=1 Tax=Channa striata TaxID=64152 RepID=A0AA88NTD4_CHASR|nr:hypothetical protein Q5P01_003915 [Channa striata]
MSEDQIKPEESGSLASGACSSSELVKAETGGLEGPAHPDILEKEVFAHEVQSPSSRKSPSASSPFSTSAVLEVPTEHLSVFGHQQLFTESFKIIPIEAEVPIEPPEEEEDKTDSGNDQHLVLNSSVFSVVLETFFQHLTEEQWREVGEGVYNHDVLEKLIYMCMTALRFISNAVLKVVLLSLHQSSDAYGTCHLMDPMTSEDLLRVYNVDIQGFVESCFSQAVHDVIGPGTPVRVSPEFTDTLATEVLHEVNSVLSVPQKGSVDGTPASPDSSQESNTSAAEKTLSGLIATMKSFLTGRATAVRSSIEIQKDTEANILEQTPGGPDTKSKQSLWNRCVGRQEMRQKEPALAQEYCVTEDNKTPHSFTSNTFEEGTRNSGFFSSKE